MKPAPSSARLRSKCTQSTIFSSSSLILFPVATSDRDTPQRVKLALAVALEWIFRRAERQAHRDRGQLQVAPHRIQQVAAIAVRELVHSRAEHHEGRRARLNLCDVAKLDP